MKKNKRKQLSDPNKPRTISQFKSFIQRDFLYIIMILIALITLVVSIGQMQEYQNTCNAHWREQWEESCIDKTVTPTPFNISYEYDLTGGYLNENNNQNPNT